MAAARGEVVPSPLDQVGWLLGPGLLPPVAESRSAVISVRAAEPRTPAPPPAAPLVPQPGDGAERTASGYNGGQANSSVGVGLPVDDDPFFLSVTAPAPVAQSAAGAAGMADPNAAGGGGGGAAPAGPVSAGVTVSGAAPAGTGQPAPAAPLFVLSSGIAPAAQPAHAAPLHPTPAAPATPVPTAHDSTPAGAMVTAAYEADMPPNAIPVANNDTATVDEDGSVVIDVLANDTDEDGDSLRIDSWNWQPAHGTVTQTDDGKLKYTPDADFDDPYQQGDTFTYTATDGQDVSDPATVTISFNPVNDPPVAFDDMYLFGNSAFRDGWDPAQGPYPYEPAGPSQTILANDFDLEDGTPAGTLSVDTTGTVGTVSVNPDGSFTWVGPWDFIGDTSFTYSVMDAAGAVSNTATVKLRAFDTYATPAAITANADSFAVGELPRTFNVTANDVGGSIAVLAAPPGVGVTGFDSDGTAHYAPRADGVPIGGPLRYNLFAGTVGVAGMATATADMNPVGLQISNGKFGPIVPDKVRETVGAFTVVNKNDTDGDGKVDNIDTAGVHRIDGVGTDEIDLMRLRVNRPAGYVEGENVIVTVTHGAGRLFLSPNREGDGTSELLVNTFINSVDGKPVDHRDFWAEVYDTSNALRDVSIQMKYKEQTMTVKATGVWVNFDPASGFHASGETAPKNDANGKAYLTTFNSLANLTGFKLGQPPMLKSPKDPQTGLPGFTVMLVNAMEAEFTVMPAGVEKEHGIRFDVRRSIQDYTWTQDAGDVHATPDTTKPFPAFRESANDNGTNNSDNDNEPTNSHIYSLDFPGWKLPIAADAAAAGNYSNGFVRMIRHMNAQEFVSVAVNGETEASSRGNGVWASRASELIDWRAWSDFQWNGTAWVRTENTADTVYNEMKLGDPRDVNTPAPP